MSFTFMVANLSKTSTKVPQNVDVFDCRWFERDFLTQVLLTQKMVEVSNRKPSQTSFILLLNCNIFGREILKFIMMFEPLIRLSVEWLIKWFN